MADKEGMVDDLMRVEEEEVEDGLWIKHSGKDDGWP